ncbi:SMP-30/gluconolactonase/LRE family protein [Paenibacillus solisilvae]|uniref:Regucalcin n=1 Tax=Paenibacillus solisilvae TaxID=2486751 RepID=A0ABW0VUG5_9BACL
MKTQSGSHTHEAELLLDTKAILAEGPQWNAEQGMLYWVDIRGEKFCRVDPSTGVNEEFSIGKKVGAVVCAGNDHVVLATSDGFETYDLKSKQLTTIVDPESDLPENRFNDGKCDSAGRFWAGTMEDVEVECRGSLYVLETDYSCRRVFGNVGVSNGIAWSLDEKEMYYIDSMKQTVTAFEFDAVKGELSSPRLLIDFQTEPGFPDGMTIDAEGMLWIAHWDGWQVSRWDPRTSKKIDSVYVPVAKASSCAFGGEKLETLFITTARVGLADDQLHTQPHAGGIFTFKPSVGGTQTYSFGK